MVETDFPVRFCTLSENPCSSPLHIGGFPAWEETENGVSSKLETANVLT